MLSPDEIERLGNQAQALLDPITDTLIRDIARRVAEAGELTSTAAYQVWRAQNLGRSQKEIRKRIQELLKVSDRQLDQLLTASGQAGYDFDLRHLPTTGAIPFAENPQMQDIVQAAVSMARDDLTNIVRTMGVVAPDGVVLPVTDAYTSLCDRAFTEAVTGVKSYTQAVHDATRELANRGVVVVDYASGRKSSVEAAVRRNVMSAAGEMQQRISQQNHDAFGANGWEISAHGGCAPDHAPIQGKQYTDAEFQSINNNLTRRIGTLNCGHAAFPIIIGVNRPTYTDQELRDLDADNEKGVTFEGQQYTTYQATQKQRQIETAIRMQRRRMAVAEETKDLEGLQKAKIREKVLLDRYDDFCQAADLRPQWERTYTATKNSRY